MSSINDQSLIQNRGMSNKSKFETEKSDHKDYSTSKDRKTASKDRLSVENSIDMVMGLAKKPKDSVQLQSIQEEGVLLEQIDRDELDMGL